MYHAHATNRLYNVAYGSNFLFGGWEVYSISKRIFIARLLTLRIFFKKLYFLIDYTLFKTIYSTTLTSSHGHYIKWL